MRKNRLREFDESGRLLGTHMGEAPASRTVYGREKEPRWVFDAILDRLSIASLFSFVSSVVRRGLLDRTRSSAAGSGAEYAVCPVRVARIICTSIEYSFLTEISWSFTVFLVEKKKYYYSITRFIFLFLLLQHIHVRARWRRSMQNDLMPFFYVCLTDNCVSDFFMILVEVSRTLLMGFLFFYPDGCARSRFARSILILKFYSDSSSHGINRRTSI